MKSTRLNTGATLPSIGFGTWQVPPGDATYNAVTEALKVGYRHIDTAAGYGNERSVGEAIRDSGIPREDIFVTTKLEAAIKDAATARQAIETSLKTLGLDTIDLFIIHAPWPWDEMGKDCKEGNVEVYRVMEEYHRRGALKAIGVSNFSVADLTHLMAHTTVVPAVNQIAFFIGLPQRDIRAYCAEHGIVIEAYSPLGIGHVLSNPDVIALSKRYQVTPAHVCLQYCLQANTVPLPKTVTPQRMRENFTFDFTLSSDDMTFLEGLENDPRRWS